ncbi:MAG: hypothetical protein QXU18_12715 [Thermoplasmatales archaeon]
MLGRVKDPVKVDEAMVYIVRIACAKPVILGLSLKLWTNRSLTEYIRKNASEQYNLRNISNGTVSKILTKSSIRE